MSRSVDLFIRSDRPIDDLAAEVTRLTGFPVTPGDPPGSWSLEADPVVADLRAHPYVDDGDLVFQRYPYVLSCRVGGDGRSSDSAEAHLLRAVGEALRGAGIPSMLVHDLQFRDSATPPPAPSTAPAAGQ